MREIRPDIRGRAVECARLDELLAGVRVGQSAAVVVRGEAGIGKTALLEYAADRAQGCRLMRSTGVESEMELAFAALHHFCSPLLAGLERLPPPQRDALGTAFGLISGPPPERLFVGLAVLGLLANAAELQPLVCLVDDAQWLDHSSAQALSFVGRRVDADSVLLLFGQRDRREPDVLAGLPEIRLRGLSDADAIDLLATRAIGPIDDRVRNRIIQEARGNPLALIEAWHTLSVGGFAGGFGLPVDHPGGVEATYRRRVSELPAKTQQLLLLAAAEPLGDPALLWRAATAAGIPAEAASPAQAEGLLDIGVRVAFRHPLLRSAIYQTAPPEARRDAHRRLAEATDPELDPDRRAWHRAHGTVALDEEVAAELERSAGRARSRGGFAAAGAFLERASELTPDAANRARRALAAAQNKHQAGVPDAALRLLAVAQAGPLLDLERARAELLHGQIMFAVNRGRDAPPLLLKAAKQLEPLDAGLARETYLEAFAAALFADRLASGGGVREVAEAILSADWTTSSQRAPRAFDDLLDGMAVLTTRGYAAGAPALKRALAEFRDEPMADEEALRWLWLACRVARAMGDDAGWDELTLRHVQLARGAGALSVLPIALTERFSVQLFLGDLTAAAALMAEAEALVDATGSHLAPQGAISLAAWQGRHEEATRLMDASRDAVENRGEGLWLTSMEWTSAVLYNSLGRYEEALSAAQKAAEHPLELGVSTWVHTELIEAAARTGQSDRALGALERLHEISSASGTDWALGVEARSRALLSEGRVAERLYLEAIERLGRTRIRVALARAHLLYGEWLRREHRRVDAREQLRAAHGAYAAMGMEAFAERARRELMATGEKVRKRSLVAVEEFTPQEVQIARLAGDGRTNPEIGAQLFLSPRTVEWHLRKVFTKLDITSRRELEGALQSRGRG
jgi:DNA-binding CsgD family transcriptional regulator/tetratricopeptide (TPR) repeat protein